MKMISIPDFELPPIDAYIQPGVNQLAANPKVEKFKKKRKMDPDQSPQFLFTQYLRGTGTYKANDGIIFEWKGSHWQAMTLP